jgi:flagellar biosynthetic protein FliR
MAQFTGMEIFQPAGASVAALLLFRMAGLVWTAPVFSAQVLPASVKTAVSVLLTVLLWPIAMVNGASAEVGVGTVLSEILIGMALGMGAAVFVSAAESAGDMVAVQMGLSGANVLDPMSRTQLPVIGQLLGLFVVSLILATGGHLMIVEALAVSLEVIPSGSSVAAAEGAMEVVSLGATLLWLGLRFAAPVVAAMMIGNVALGVVARTVPQLNVLVVAFPVQIGIGLFVLAATLPMMASGFQSWDVSYEEVAGRLLEAMSTSEDAR